MTPTFPKKKRIKNRKVLDEASSAPCIICFAKADPAHIRSRGAGGDDENSNLLALCRAHHTEQHAIGFVRFTEKHPKVLKALQARGWEIVELFGIKKLARK